MASPYLSKVEPNVTISSPELKLWKAVLCVAVEDALNELDIEEKGCMNFVQYKSRHRDYFLKPTRAVFTVCKNAGYDPEYVIRKMKKKLCKEVLSVPNAKAMAFVEYLKTQEIEKKYK